MKTTLERRVHSVIIDDTHPLYERFDAMCWASRALYNSLNYELRQAFFDKDKKMPTVSSLRKKYRAEENQHWMALPSKVAREVALGLQRDWKSYWEKRKKGDVLARPPKYHKDKARRHIEFANDALTQTGKKDGHLTLTTLGKEMVIHLPCAYEKICSVRVLPVRKKYKIEVVYKIHVPVIEPVSDTKQVWAGGDLGVDNFLTVAIDNAVVKPLIISGKEVKSKNQYANKHSAQVRKNKTKRKGNHDKTIDWYVRSIWESRNSYIEGFIHNATSYIVEYLRAFGVTHFVVGWNKNWKSAKLDKETNPGMGKKNNQTFRSLPYRKFLTVLEYKLREAGIVYLETEESYTSKTSVIAGELPVKHDTYAARRVHRGLIKVKETGVCLNADVNGACQIVRKCKPEAFSWAEGVEGKAGLFSPVRVSVGGGCPTFMRESFLARKIEAGTFAA